MSKLFSIFKKTYIFIVLALMYIPLFVGAIYSFSASPAKGNMSHIFNYTGDGWNKLLNGNDLSNNLLASTIIALFVSIIVVSLSLLTVFGLWRSKSKTAKAAVTGTYQIPLINPDVITAIALMLTFGMMFGLLQKGESGFERVVIAKSVMIIPFGITIMYPHSDKFSKSLLEASHDLGYGHVRTWCKTYLRHMLGVMAVTFLVSTALAFDDFIIARITSRVETIGTKIYSESLRPWVLALGTIVMTITLSSSFMVAGVLYYKNRKRRKIKSNEK